jgi:hypothetical protein
MSNLGLDHFRAYCLQTIYLFAIVVKPVDNGYDVRGTIYHSPTSSTIESAPALAQAPR